MKKHKKIVTVIIVLLVIIAIVALFIMSSPQKRIARQLELAKKYVAEMEYEEAILVFEKIIEIDPRCEEAYLSLADVYIAMGDYEAAAKVLEQASEMVDSEKIRSKIEELNALVDAQQLPVIDGELEGWLEVVLDCSYDVYQEDYLSTEYITEYVRIWPNDEPDIMYSYHPENVESPWNEYVGLAWQEEYFLGAQEEVIKSYVETGEFDLYEITDQFPDILEFNVQGVSLAFDIQNVYIYPLVGAGYENEPYTYHEKTEIGYAATGGYLVDFVGEVYCDDSYKPLFEKIEISTEDIIEESNGENTEEITEESVMSDIVINGIMYELPSSAERTKIAISDLSISHEHFYSSDFVEPGMFFYLGTQYLDNHYTHGVTLCNYSDEACHYLECSVVSIFLDCQYENVDFSIYGITQNSSEEDVVNAFGEPYYDYRESDEGEVLDYNSYYIYRDCKWYVDDYLVDVSFVDGKISHIQIASDWDETEGTY